MHSPFEPSDWAPFRRGPISRRGMHRGPGPRGRGHGRRPRVDRGDVRVAVLTLLKEGPRHGYQIMTDLGERTGGVWQPSPGSIYPLLQLLSDEGLVDSAEEQGRRVYHLTDAGQQAAEEAATETPIWEQIEGADDGINIRNEMSLLGAAAAQATAFGASETGTQVAAILREARKQIYALLAE